MTARTLLAALCVALASVETQAASQRHTIIISDLHLGVGKEPGGDYWLATEDFRWTDDFSKFLAWVSAETGDTTDLVIAGDMFELWQSPRVEECIYANRNFGCSEAEAETRIRHVLRAHANDIRLIAEFAAKGTNTVNIVPGNHDAALFFPGVQTMVKEAFGAAARLTIRTEGYWISHDGEILVEHGQQIGRDVNRFDRWPEPFVGPSTDRRIQRTWGEQFVQSFYNQYEDKYPVIDNIGDNGGLGFGLSAEGLSGTGMAVGKFLRFYLTGSSWAQFGSSLGGAEEGAPEWDLERIRADGDVFFYESVPTDDPLRLVAERAYRNGELGLTLSDLSDEEIRSICDSRLALYQLETKGEVARSIGPCASQQPLGAVAQLVLGPARAKLVRARALELFRELRDAGVLIEPFDLYVYGHTHSAAAEQTIEIDDSWSLSWANSGAWQRIVSPGEFRALQCHEEVGEALRMSLQRLPSCYPVVWVRPYVGRPLALVRFWNDSGSLDSSCRWVAPPCR